jgi:ABC-type transport system involved in multi-copper enzyme maturation permease subunit
MKNKTGIIAYYTFREGTQNRLFRLTLVGLLCLLGIAEFTGELAITETRNVQAALLASFSRWFLVMTSALFVITSMVREFNDKGTEQILSLPVSKTGYYFGKFLGFMSLSLVIAISICLILSLYTEFTWLVVWFISLICETAIIIGVSMLCMFTFSNITISFMAVIAFYLLSRTMEAIQLLSTSPILESNSFSQDFMTALVNGIAYFLPDLNRFSNSEWLVYGIEGSDLGFNLLQTLIYLVFLIAAGLFDLSRKQF